MPITPAFACYLSTWKAKVGLLLNLNMTLLQKSQSTRIILGPYYLDLHSLGLGGNTTACLTSSEAMLTNPSYTD